MKQFLLALVLLLPCAALADRVGTYDNARVYLYEKPCQGPGSEGLKSGAVHYNDGKKSSMCWVEEQGVVWIVEDGSGRIAAEDAKRFKELLSI